MFGPAALIARSPPAEIDASGNNIARIQQLLPLARRAADDLIGHLNPNAFPELVRDVADYRAALTAEDKFIAWGIVFGLGVMLEVGPPVLLLLDKWPGSWRSSSTAPSNLGERVP